MVLPGRETVRGRLGPAIFVWLTKDQAPAANSASITRRFATASSGSTGSGAPSRTASAKRSASQAYGSAGAKVSVSVAGATGGSPPAVTKIRVGRSGGMLNGISTEIRPLGAVDVDPLVGLRARRARERRDAGRELEDAAGQHVDAEGPGRGRSPPGRGRARPRTASATG